MTFVNYKLDILPPLPGNGGCASSAYAVNANGDVVGYSKDQGVVWNPNQHKLLPLAGDAGTTGTDINKYGEVVGKSGSGSDPNEVTNPIWWSVSGLAVGADAAPVALANPPGMALTLKINDMGKIIGRVKIAGAARAFVWEGGVWTILDSLGGDPSSSCRGMNENGDIVGLSKGVAQSAVLWPNGKTTPTLLQLQRPLARPSLANAVTDDHVVVGYATHVATHKKRAVLWRNEAECVDLGVLSGFDESEAMGVTHDTDGELVVIGRCWHTTTGIGSVFIWTEYEGMEALQDLLYSELDAGSFLDFAHDINANGDIVGDGFFLGGTINCAYKLSL